MSVYDHDVITRALIIRERLAQLRLHQTEQRQRLHALALRELLDAGYSTREAGDVLGLSRTFVHRVASGAAEPSEERPEFEEIDAARDLARAEGERDTFARRIIVPPGLLLWLGLGVALQIAGAGLVWQSFGFVFTFTGALVYAVIAVLLSRRFQRANGVRIGGFVSRMLCSTATNATMVYLLALAGAMWAGYVGTWAVMAVCAAAGGAGFAISGAQWIRRYRSDPVSHARGESVALLVVMGALAVCGTVLLLVFR